MKIGLLAVFSALALVILVRISGPQTSLPEWSPFQLIAHFQATAKQMGVDAGKTNPDPSLDITRNPREPRLVVRAEYRRAVLRAEYAADGRLLDWHCRHCSALASNSSSERQALEALGARLDAYRLLNRDHDRGTSRWQSNDSEAEITIEDGIVTNAAIHPIGIQPSPANPPGSSLLKAFRGLSTSVFWFYISIAGILFAIYFFRRSDVRRVSYAIVLFWLLAYFAGLLFDWRSTTSVSAWYQVLGRPTLWILPCAAGLALIRGTLIDRWIGLLRAAAYWRPGNRTGMELWDGLLLGWPLALAAFAGPSSDIATQKVPALSGVLARHSIAGDIVLFYAFIVPITYRWIKNARWRSGTLALLGLLYFVGLPHTFAMQPWIELLSGMAVFGLLSWTYVSFGLLTVLSAALASTMAAPIAWLATSPLAHWASLTASMVVYCAALAGASWLRRQDHLAEDEELAAEIARRNAPANESEIRSERQLLLTEFAEAREAQMGMLPAQAPVIQGFSLAATCVPAREVGGDLYDIIPFPDGQWGLCVADVSGKGVPAALYMTMTKGVLASEQRVTSDLKTLALALNERLHEAGHRKIFVTMALARLDLATRCVQVLRAGHNPLLWRRAARNETVWLKPNGIGLGLVGNRTFEKKLELQIIDLQPGDTLLLYSDGLTEAEDPNLELFGETRLQQMAERADSLSAEAFLEQILLEVNTFKQGADPHDDLTLLVLKSDVML